MMKLFAFANAAVALMPSEFPASSVNLLESPDIRNSMLETSPIFADTEKSSMLEVSTIEAGLIDQFEKVYIVVKAIFEKFSKQGSSMVEQTTGVKCGDFSSIISSVASERNIELSVEDFDKVQLVVCDLL